jgi:hypothetical protein
MPRRDSDLLAVFRPSSSGGPGGAKPPADRKPGPRRRFEGVFLGPRQVLLGSSVVVLLLVLSFTVGIGVGRSGERSGVAPSLERETAVWVLRGRLGAMDFARAETLDAEGIARELESKYGVPRRMVRVDGTGEPIWVTIGSFRTREEAQRFLTEHRLATARLGSAAPFRTAVPIEVRLR